MQEEFGFPAELVKKINQNIIMNHQRDFEQINEFLDDLPYFLR